LKLADTAVRAIGRSSLTLVRVLLLENQHS